MPVIEATPETYPQLIAQPGLTLVMYDVARERYRNDRRIRAAFRRLARERADRFRFVLVDMERIPVSAREIAFLPTFVMYRDGQRIGQEQGRYHGDVSSDVSLVQFAEGFLPEGDRRVLTSIVYPLRHGIELTVDYIRAPVEVVHVANFLAGAIEHFQRYRDKPESDLYTAGAYRGSARYPRRRALCTFRLSHPGDQEGRYLTAAQWLEAVGAAYCSATTLEDILEDLSGWRADAERSGSGWLRDVIEALERPYGHLLALRHVFRELERTDESQRGGADVAARDGIRRD